MQVIQQMVCHHASPTAPMQLAELKATPQCRACLQGKAYKPSHNKHHSLIAKKQYTSPGTSMSINHVEADQPCYFWQTKGVNANQCYKYFSLYMLITSCQFLYSYFQEGKTAAEMLKGKHTAFTKALGVNIQPNTYALTNSEIFTVNDITLISNFLPQLGA